MGRVVSMADLLYVIPGRCSVISGTWTRGVNYCNNSAIGKSLEMPTAAGKIFPSLLPLGEGVVLCQLLEGCYHRGSSQANSGRLEYGVNSSGSRRGREELLHARQASCCSASSHRGTFTHSSVSSYVQV